mmetsp:Transcript_17149/g.49945  ORF Transcript_17149/g.49945 Transcript_17149/m.49945 type:complete len:200 (+) Transcript_17149:776-1375(+)
MCEPGPGDPGRGGGHCLLAGGPGGLFREGPQAASLQGRLRWRLQGQDPRGHGDGGQDRRLRHILEAEQVPRHRAVQHRVQPDCTELCPGRCRQRRAGEGYAQQAPQRQHCHGACPRGPQPEPKPRTIPLLPRQHPPLLQQGFSGCQALAGPSPSHGARAACSAPRHAIGFLWGLQLDPVVSGLRALVHECRVRWAPRPR